MDDDNSTNSTDLPNQGIALELNVFQMVFHSIAFFIGVPLNIAVGTILISNKPLYNVRNFIWLGVILSNLIIFFMLVLEYLIVYFRSHLVCQILSQMVGKPYLILLTNILVATSDRLVYTKWPLFHERHVTARLIISIQATLSLVIILAFTFAFMDPNDPFPCRLDPVIAQVSSIVMAPLCLLCITLKVAILILILKTRGIAARPPSSVSNEATNSLELTDVTNRPRVLLHCSIGRIGRLERSATVSVLLSSIPFCLFLLLYFVYVSSYRYYRDFLKDYQVFNHFRMFFRELIVLHVATSLLFYVFRSQEFRSIAVRNLGFRLIFTRIREQ